MPPLMSSMSPMNHTDLAEKRQITEKKNFCIKAKNTYWHWRNLEEVKLECITHHLLEVHPF